MLVDGIVLTPNWTETLKSFEVGESRTFRRPTMTATRARSIASKINREKKMFFSVKSEEFDEYVTIKREE